MNYPEKITINVTEQDIIKGVPDDTLHCPIARAFNRKLHMKMGVRAMPLTITIHDNIYGPWETYYYTTDASIRFMEDFDHGRSVKPRKFTFERATF